MKNLQTQTLNFRLFMILSIGVCVSVLVSGTDSGV